MLVKQLLDILEGDVENLKAQSWRRVDSDAESAMDARFGNLTAGRPQHLQEPETSLEFPSQTHTQNIPAGHSVLELVDTWLTFYHPWFTILHQPSILSEFTATQLNLNPEKEIVLKAIIVVTSTGHQGSSYAMYDEVLLHAIKSTVLSSLQALLILSLADLSCGRLSDFWKVIALCRKWASLVLYFPYQVFE